jgi:hypothetical protein
LGQKNQKSSHGGSVLGRGDPIGAGYAGVEVVRGHALRLFTVAPPTDFIRSSPHLFAVRSPARPRFVLARARPTSHAFGLCLFALGRPRVHSVCVRSPLFALVRRCCSCCSSCSCRAATAYPAAAVAVAHTCALSLARPLVRVCLPCVRLPHVCDTLL